MARAVRRATSAVLIVALVAGVAAVAWLIGRRAAEAGRAGAVEPVEESIPAAPVERRVLEKTIVTRGQVELSKALTVPLGGVSVGRGIVTAAQQQGAMVDEGQVALEVDGRPVFVFVGDKPSYRDLSRDVEGPDVAQLQEALARAGLAPGDVDGVFGRDIEAAVVRLYVRAGYEPPLAGELSSSSRRRVRELWSAWRDGCSPSADVEACPVAGELAEAYVASKRPVHIPYPEALFVADLPAVVGEGSAKTGDASSSAVLELA